MIRNDETDCTPENRHDAALIAAAPAMAQMLRSLVAKWTDDYHCCVASKARRSFTVGPMPKHDTDCPLAKAAALLSTLPESGE